MERRTVDDLVESLQEASSMVVNLLDDGVETSVMIEPGGWALRQVVVHLIAGMRMYAGCLRGVPSPIGDFRPHTLEAFNGGSWMALGEEDSRALGRILNGCAREMAASVPEPEVDRTWHAGISMPTPFFVRTMVSELLLHGFDIASALGQAWSPSDRTAGPASTLFMDVAPLLLRRDESEDHAGRYWFGDATPTRLGSHDRIQ